jgi:hypothetical protein
MLSKREKMAVKYTLLMVKEGNDGRRAANTWRNTFTPRDLRTIRGMVGETLAKRKV